VPGDKINHLYDSWLVVLSEPSVYGSGAAAICSEVLGNVSFNGGLAKFERHSSGARL
jgi:hypothetical protein